MLRDSCTLVGIRKLINDFNELLDVLDEGDGAFWEEYDETLSDLNFSALSQITDPDYTYDDTPVMGWNYGVVGTFSWGGYTAQMSLFDQILSPVPQYLLSRASSRPPCCASCLVNAVSSLGSDHNPHYDRVPQCPAVPRR